MDFLCDNSGALCGVASYSLTRASLIPASDGVGAKGQSAIVGLVLVGSSTFVLEFAAVSAIDESFDGMFSIFAILA